MGVERRLRGGSLLFKTKIGALSVAGPSEDVLFEVAEGPGGEDPCVQAGRANNNCHGGLR